MILALGYVLHVWALTIAKNERQTKELVPNDATKHRMLDIMKLISKKKDICICKTDLEFL